ncbi:hypothetical protein ACWEQL_24350 [Kitasatospora sp. NPDC004240]
MALTADHPRAAEPYAVVPYGVRLRGALSAATTRPGAGGTLNDRTMTMGSGRWRQP